MTTSLRLFLLVGFLGAICLVSGFQHQEQHLLAQHEEPEDNAEPTKPAVTAEDKAAGYEKGMNFLQSLKDLMTSDPKGLYVRIEIFEPDPPASILDATCLSAAPGAKLAKNIYIGRDTCSYDLSRIFRYDTETKTLMSMQFPDTYANVNPKYRAVGTDAYRIMFHDLDNVKERESTSSDEAYQIFGTPKQWGPLIFRNMAFGDDGLNYCWQILATSAARAIPLSKEGETASCTVMRIIPLADDISEGVIATPDKAQCATYNADVEDQSVLSLSACDPANANQQFLFNEVTGQVRWKRDLEAGFFANPAIFMWWSGNLKSYETLPPTGENNYGWDFSSGYAISRDTRGYSGFCWTVLEDSQIVVNQTCSALNFYPTVGALARANDDYRSTAVQVQVKDADGTISCLYFNRGQEKIETQKVQRTKRRSLLKIIRSKWKFSKGKVSFFQVELRECDADPFRSVRQRFILSAPAASQCAPAQLTGEKECAGHVRWSGDPQNSLIWMRRKLNVDAMMDPNTNVNEQYSELDPDAEEVIMTPQSGREVDMKWSWKLPINKWAPIKPSEGEGCWTARDGQKHKKLYFSRVGQDCLEFKLAPLVRRANLPASVNLITAYEGPTSVIVSLDPKFDKIVKGMGKLVRGSARVREWLQGAFASIYYADLSFWGTHRVNRVNTRMTAKSLKVDLGGYVTAPFVAARGDVATSPFGLITLNFELSKPLLHRSARRGSKYLFGFRRITGCVAYVTEAGSLGLSCTWDSGKTTTCQVRFTNLALNDEKPHEVGLLYSTDVSKPSLLYVEKQLVGSCPTSGKMTLAKAAQSVSVFSDPNTWQFGASKGEIIKFRVSTGAYDDLKKVAAGDIPDAPAKLELEGGPSGVKIEATLLPALSTTWDSCQPTEKDGQTVSISCQLNVRSASGAAISVPRDAFSLACSRPLCDIRFDDKQPDVGSKFQFTYSPNYPTTFLSEDVGSPDRFPDTSMLTDGFTNGNADFGIKYEPAITAEEALLELGVSDVMRYRCKEACCSAIRAAPPMDGGDMF
eukprot:TRINITY_DN2446_c0_g1_i6.p1 TRINITY_DN2446_c0_g1~~TRINITY_DN2446_c0_g1_i6.p1  ORF type:complete len:1050 (+),score=413.15 TRINITY_DN2446_c0_g1_i6:55-3150(+)